ncbi:hypothetical protein [Microcystis sp. M38BS1]
MNNQSNDLTKKIQELEAQVNELSEANKSLDEGIAKLARRRLYSGLGD